MKKITLSILPILFALSIHAQEVKNIKYFDVDNKEINEQTFQEKRSTNAFLDIPGDAVNHLKLINREERGKINNRKELVALLENASKEKIGLLQQIVIIYYPGQDACNATGDINSITSHYKEIEKGVNKISKAKTFYIYKNEKGIEKYNNKIRWIKDPEQFIEKLFFKYHYPCGSFSVISKTDDYISYFGEFYKDLVFEASKKLGK